MLVENLTNLALAAQLNCLEALGLTKKQLVTLQGNYCTFFGVFFFHRILKMDRKPRSLFENLFSFLHCNSLEMGKERSVTIRVTTNTYCVFDHEEVRTVESPKVVTERSGDFVNRYSICI